MLMRISVQRAQRERAAYTTMGTARAWNELVSEELRRTWAIAQVMRECKLGRQATTNLSAIERETRALELQLERLRHGLATPSHLKTQDDIARLEALVMQVAQAQRTEPLSREVRLGVRRSQRRRARSRRAPKRLNSRQADNGQQVHNRSTYWRRG
jgi:hypothetical protein